MEKTGDCKDLFQCPHCWKRFKRKKHLNQHIRVKHLAQPEVRKSNLRCPDETCDFACYRHVDLRLHAAMKHSCVLEEITMCFSTVAEFQLWKLQEEKTIGSVFMKHTSGKKLCRDIIKEYYRCHYSQRHSPAAQRKLMQKKELSEYVVIACPATIEVQKTADGSLQVTYFKTHFGHEVQDKEQSVLSAEDCRLIAQKLKDGMPVNELLYEIKKSSTLSKALTRKELYSVAKKCNLFKLKPREKKCPRPKNKKKKIHKETTPNENTPKLIKSDVISKLKYAALLAECTTTSDDTVVKIDEHINKVIEILQEAHIKTFEAETSDTVTKTSEPSRVEPRSISELMLDHSYASGQNSSTQPDHNYASDLPVFDHSYASDLQKFYSNSVSELFDHSYALDFQDLDQNCAPYLSPLPLPCFDHSYALDFQEFEHSYACDFDLMKV